MEKLIKIQKELNVPKGQTNTFGGYKYRSCEDILEALKPLLYREKVLLSLTDEIIQMGDRYYIHAKAVFIDGETKISVSAYAREAEIKKGMDSAQITGACSSYARKYALNGLFLIDDTNDADTQDNRVKEIQISKEKTDSEKYNELYTKLNKLIEEAPNLDALLMVKEKLKKEVITKYYKDKLVNTYKTKKEEFEGGAI